MPETFSPKTWADGQAGGTPIVAAELNRLEQGVESMDDRTAALELGVDAAVVVTYSASVTVDASLGALFRITATGDLTIAAISNGVEGQLITIQVRASGLDRQVTWSVGGISTVTIPSGTWGTWTLRYNSGTAAWALGATSQTATGGAYTDEQAQDAAAALFTGGSHSGISFSYVDASNIVNATVTPSVLLSTFTTKGDLVAATGSGAVARLGVGADGRCLVADSAQSTGLNYSASNPILVGTVTTKGDLLAATGSGAIARRAVGADGTLLVADSAQSTGLNYTSDYVKLTTIAAKGDLYVGTANDSITNVGVGSNGTQLTADSGQGSGVGWQANPTPAPVALSDIASVPLDAAAGQVFKLTATASRTIAAPTNAVDGRGIIIAHVASGGAWTLALTTGSAGAFAFGTDITALTATTSGKTDYIGAIYDGTAQRWRVISYVKGL